MGSVDSNKFSPLLKSFLAGSFSGTCSTILFQPLDLVKTRLQTPLIAGSSSAGSYVSHSNGMIAIASSVVKNDHVIGLWRGILPSLARCVPGVGLYFSSLHWLKSIFCNGTPDPLMSIFLGASARTFSGVVLIPITVVKTRYESGVYGYKSITDALRQIRYNEGSRGLVCGLLPTILRDAPFSGIYLMFYTQAKKSLPKEVLENNLSSLAHFSCGLTAGALASALTQPFDVVKTKMQLYPHKFNGILPVIFHVYEKYGYAGYFKGLVPRMLRRALMASMAWTVYEKTTKYLQFT